MQYIPGSVSFHGSLAVPPWHSPDVTTGLYTFLHYAQVLTVTIMLLWAGCQADASLLFAANFRGEPPWGSYLAIAPSPAKVSCITTDELAVFVFGNASPARVNRWRSKL